MPPFFRWLADLVLHDLGVPAAANRWIGANPKLRIDLATPLKTINVHDIVRWDRWGGVAQNDAGVVQWWEPAGADWRVETRLRHSIEETTTSNWACDIRAVAGFAASKSELSDFRSTDDMVEANSRSMIEPPRIWWRLQLLRKWSHEQVEQVFC
ncbi:DUF6685 family protein [Paraburkholderia sp. MM5477-R1]|uniref:DUF6685 family protein n=1 Tax=Paraburkholderia sp. MM5477-R1 TaxID=2991062 RepID=UPI003D1C5CDE